MYSNDKGKKKVKMLIFANGRWRQLAGQPTNKGQNKWLPTVCLLEAEEPVDMQIDRKVTRCRLPLYLQYGKITIITFFLERITAFIVTFWIEFVSEIHKFLYVSG